ncbi:MAG: DNA mismatch repair endonuclease MutL [Armatimonadetes bacterium]|nr:DNA mismatch repair endonuclease MutL [Armatimonadota bacterium]
MAINRIQILDDNTANRIAAGEVVERPASAVKELVENAIDANATQITVTLEEGGTKCLSVMDNGHGMSRADSVLCLQRHATSKIKTADDLFSIRTLGFRGEALPSIASVSKFTLTSKPEDEESGTEIVILGGDIESVSEVAVRDGTTMEIRDLFYNTPARLKFLKSTPAELSRTVEVVGHLAIANPAIAFRVRHGSNETFSTPGTGDHLAAIAAVWSRDIARKLIPIEHETGDLHVQGFIATPDLTRPGRSHELFYVNGRPIKSRLLGHALEEAFRSLTPESRYPIAVIFVDIHPDMVDVNVHPTKTEVKFTRDGEVHHAVSQAVKSALLAYGIVPSVRSSILPTTPLDTTSLEERPPSQFQLPMPVERGMSTPSYRETPSSHNQSHHSFSDMVDAVIEGFAPPESTSHPALQAQEESSLPTTARDPFEEEALEVRPRPKPFAEQLREFQVLGQARNTYIIALTPAGIAVIDQHVAHERVLYERLTVKRMSNGIPMQRLAIPVTLTLGKREALLLTEHLESFSKSGWEIALFGGESFVVRAIPAVLVKKSYELILRDMIDELVNQSISRRLLVLQDHVTITNACKMAVKAGDPLGMEEMRGLLEQLAETENPYLCPHGRPIVVTIAFKDLDKQFKRA